MLRVCTSLLLLLLVSGCGLVRPSSARDLGEQFADALEGRSDAAFETYLAPGSTIYLQGGAQITPPAFRSYVERMKNGDQVFHRVSQVYVTPNGAGWLIGITRGLPPDPYANRPTLWMEAAIDPNAGRITRVWVHFTLETLQALHQPPDVYMATMARLGLPLPEEWALGTPALIASAERYDAQAGDSPFTLDARVGVPFAAAVAGLMLVMRVAPSRRGADSAAARAESRSQALLQALRERRTREASPSPCAVMHSLDEEHEEVGSGTGTAIPV